jgi:hypothetical protein
MLRFGLGVLLGFCLAGQSLWSIGVGHGSAAPLFFALSVLGFVVSSFPLSAFLAGPLLWGAYFLLIPDIAHRGTRIVVLTVALVSHLLVGFWMMSEDSGSYQFSLPASGMFVATFLIAVGGLTWITLKRRAP